MPENRSCQEFIPEEPNFPRVNCALCVRWNPDEEKCREMIWVKEWIAPMPNSQEPIEIIGWCSY